MVSLILLIASSLASAGLIEGATLDVSSNAGIVARQQRGGQQGGQQGGNQGGQQGGQQGGNQGGQQGGNQGGQQGGQTCLNNDLIQSASGLTGQEAGTEGIKAGQAPSAV
jgi:transcription initiation factor TFIID subunit 15